MERIKKEVVIYASLVLALVVTSTLHYFVMIEGVQYEAVTIPSTAADYGISATLALPKDLKETDVIPGVLVFHGWLFSKETMIHIAQALARVGYAALAVDLAGHGANGGSAYYEGVEEQRFALDARDAYNFLQDHENVNASQIGAVGWSRGGTAMALMTHEGLAFVDAYVFLGYRFRFDYRKIEAEQNVTCKTDPNAQQMKNVLIMAGNLDEVVSREAVLESLSCLIDEDEPRADVRYGNIENGTAREASFGTADHLFVIFDDGIIKKTLKWFLEAIPSTYLSDAELQRMEDTDSYPSNYASWREFFGGIVGFLWFCLLMVLVDAFSPERSDERNSGNTRKDTDISSKLENQNTEKDLTLLQNIPDGGGTEGHRFWWPISAFVYLVGISMGTNVGSFSTVNFVIAFGTTYLVWYLILTLWLVLYFRKITGGFAFLRYQNIKASAVSEGPKYSSHYAVAVVLLVWIGITQSVMASVPFHYSMSSPLISSWVVEGAPGKRFLLFLVLWLLLLSPSYFETELHRIMVSRDFTVKNVLVIFAARGGAFALFFAGIVIATAAGASPGGAGFISFFMYPFGGIFLLMAILTQFARSKGYSVAAVTTLYSGYIAFFLSVFSAFAGLEPNN